MVSILVTGLLAAIMGNIGFGAGSEYQAIFSNASMIEKGDDVRVAGVSVGEVKKVEHYERNHALVTFRVKDGRAVDHRLPSRGPLPQPGRRPLPRARGGPGPDAEPLDEDQPLPIEQTSPALDLTTLFNGFKPLFQALKPEDVNELTLNLVQVLQGEGGTVQGLLRRPPRSPRRWPTATSSIGDVVDNLTTTLRDRRQPLGAAHHAGHRAEGLDAGPRPRPEHDRVVAVEHLRPHRRRGRPAARRPAAAQGRHRRARELAALLPRSSRASWSSSCWTGCRSR